MSREPIFGAALASAALWRCVLVYAFTSIAGAANLRHGGTGDASPGVGEMVMKKPDQNLHWETLSSHGKALAKGPPGDALRLASHSADYLYDPEKMQYNVIKMAADTETLKGKAQIGQAGQQSANQFIQEIKALNASVVREQAYGALEIAIHEEQKQLHLLEAEEQRVQAVKTKKMEDDAKYMAQISAAHMRETAESWASNQAYNYVAAAASQSLKDAMATATQLPAIRQEATEYAKGAIKSASETLKVAQKAQFVSDKVPQAAMQKAVTYAEQLRSKQTALNGDIKAVEKREEETNQLAVKAHKGAMIALAKAIEDEKQSSQYLERARKNARTIAKLKEAAQTVLNQADHLN